MYYSTVRIIHEMLCQTKIRLLNYGIYKYITISFLIITFIPYIKILPNVLNYLQYVTKKFNIVKYQLR